MKNVLRPSFLLSLGLLSFVVSLPFFPSNRPGRTPFAFEVMLAAPSGGMAQLYYDVTGKGLSETDSSRVMMPPSPRLLAYRFPLPTGWFRMLRFDPINNDGAVWIANARITGEGGEIVRTFDATDFTPLNQVASVTPTGDAILVRPSPAATDPMLGVRLDPPLLLSISGFAGVHGPLAIVLRTWLALLVVSLAGAWLIRRARARATAGPGRFAAWLQRHPGWSVNLVAAVAVVVSCYPVVFLGRSFVSPNFSDGTLLLYDGFPTLPGYTSVVTEDAKGSDVGAIIWAGVPMSMVQHEAVFHHGEVPLWNRYNSCGTALLGQGQSMFGDPLHLLVVAANGAAWAWDVKYLIAKWLFAAVLGLIVLQVTRHRPAAMITAFSSAFIGFFVYRVNHPAFFSMCYAPLILYAWVRLKDAADRRGIAGWCAFLVGASWMTMLSGTAKEAYMLLIGLNLTGAIVVSSAALPFRERVRRLLAAAIAGVVFVLLSSPVWLVFLDTLRNAYTAYNRPTAFQIHPSLLVGLFDGIFYRPLQQAERVFNPSANFLVLGGMLYLLATLRRAPAGRTRIALLAGAFLPLSLAFGLVPPQWIERVPFLGNVAHIDNTFSCVLIIHLIVLAGIGFRIAAERLGTPEGRGDLMTAGALLLALLFPYIALTQTVHRAIFGTGTTFRFLEPGHRMPVSPFVWGSLAALTVAILLLGWIARYSLRRRTLQAAPATLAIACAVVLLWRHGQQLPNRFDDYVFNPAPRVDFHARSPSIDFLCAHQEDPSRIAGVSNLFFPGWSAAYQLEGICGPDALINPYYRQLIDAFGIRRDWDWRIIVDPETLSRLIRAYDFLNLRFYLVRHGAPNPAPDQLRRVLDADLSVLESETSWPRAFFTDRVAVYSNPAELRELVSRGDGRPFAAIEQSQEQAPISSATKNLDGRTIEPATGYHLTNNTTSFDVVANGPGMIVLQEASWPGDCRVVVDGRPAKCVRVNHAFRGVWVETAGNHHVTFEYWPQHFTLGLVLAGLGLAVGGGLLWWVLVRKTGKSIQSAG